MCNNKIQNGEITSTDFVRGGCKLAMWLLALNRFAFRAKLMYCIVLAERWAVSCVIDCVYMIIIIGDDVSQFITIIYE